MRRSSVIDGDPFAHTILRVSRRVVVSHVTVECFNDSHFLISQCEIEDGQVLDEALHLLGFRNGDGASLHSPTQEYLRGGLGIASGDISDYFLAHDGRLVAFQIELNVGQGPKVTEGHGLDSFFLAHSKEV